MRNLLVNVTSEITKLILDISKVIVNALIVALSVVLYAMKVLEKLIDIIRDDDTRSLGRCAFGGCSFGGCNFGGNRHEIRVDGWNTTTRATRADTRGSSWHRKRRR